MYLVENLLLIKNNNKRQHENDDQETLIQQLHQFRCFEILFHGTIKSNDSKKLVDSRISIFWKRNEPFRPYPRTHLSGFRTK